MSRRRGPHVGPVALTPARTAVGIALAGGLAFLAYSVIVRDQLQIPLMASGFLITGLALAAVAVIGASNLLRDSRRGRDGRAFLDALAGGVAAAGAFLCFGAALVFALIWRGSGG